MPGDCAICAQPSQATCGGCKLVFYCGKEHQRQHWKQEHRATCSPLYKIETNDVLGRHMIAAKDIQQGELIFMELPVVTGPKAYTFPICLGCNTPLEGEFHICDGCGFPLCKPQCQVSDLHFDECRTMMENKYRIGMNPAPTKKEVVYMSVLPLRCFILKQKYPERYKKIEELQSNAEYRTHQNNPLYPLYQRNLSLMKQCLGEQYDEELMLKLMGILDTNCFEIRVDKMKIRALYSLASMLEHSCVPNCKHTFLSDDWIMAVYATLPIKKGEHIQATYTQSFWGTLERRLHLKMAKCFDCICERCSDPTELGTYVGAIRCMSCATMENYSNGPKILSTNPLDNGAEWKCMECGRSINSKQMNGGNKSLEEEIANIDKTTPDGLEHFLTKYASPEGGVLHATNTHVVQIKYALIQIYGNTKNYLYTDIKDEQLQAKIDYCHELIELLEKLDPGMSRLRGVLLCELQSAMTIQAKRDFDSDRNTKQETQKILEEALTLLGEAIQILKVEPDYEQELKDKLESLSKELNDEPNEDEVII